MAAERKRSRWPWVVAGIVAALLMLWGAALIARAIWFPGIPFDAAVWIDPSSQANGARLKMADRLVAQGVLRGKSRDMVTSLLGVPPPTDYFRDWDLVYYLGPERGWLSIDSEWLVVRFRKDDRVTEYRIVRD